MIRILVADDSATARALLTSIFEEAGMQVVGQAHHGQQAVQLARELQPDLITMDIHMPELDGFEATQLIMAQAPTRIVMVTSADPRDVRASLRATQVGALMVLPKPGRPGTERYEEQRARMVSMVRALADVRVVRQWTPGLVSPRLTPPHPRSSSLPAMPRAVAIAASTGGPAALVQLLAALPAEVCPPVLVVQHIAAGFVKPLVQWLAQSCRARVKLAESRELAVPGTVYLPPEGWHMGIGADGRITLSDAPAIRGFRPSASHLFEAVGRSLGADAVAVILTGMGDDGVAGLRVAHAAGTYVVAQDEATSVVFGMPREAAEAGLTDEVLPLAEIAQRLAGFRAGGPHR